MAWIEPQIHRNEYVPRADREVPLEAYIGNLIHADTELRDGTRAGYLSVLRTHIAGTRLGRTKIGGITTTQLRDYWTGLGAGVERATSGE